MPDQNNTNSKKSKSKILIVASGLIVFTLGGLAGYGFRFFQIKKLSSSIAGQTPQLTTNQLSEKDQLEKLLSETIDIRAYWISPDRSRTIAVLGKQIPETYPSDLETGFLWVGEDLAIVDNGEKQVQEVNLKRLIGERFDEIYKNAPIQFQLRVHHLGWSKDSQNFWGQIEIHSSADPSFPSDMVVFNVNIAEHAIDLYPINLQGSFNYFQPEAFNPETGILLAEVINQNLELYLYDIPKKTGELVVSYPIEALEEYFGKEYLTLKYFYLFFQPDFEKRQLEPNWLDDQTFSYLDFETREKIVKTIPLNN